MMYCTYQVGWNNVVQAVGGGKNGSCLWASEWLGVNKSHPAAQAYYDSRIELLASRIYLWPAVPI